MHSIAAFLSDMIIIYDEKTIFFVVLFLQMR